ncbi:MAG: enoyl-CoA hydratase [Deltaproteobacteria bacterium]|nr:enoyl-CoA hydratase [Deltaproteobacteria bacterium]
MSTPPSQTPGSAPSASPSGNARPLVRYAAAEGIARITLDQPGSLNVLSLAMLTALRDALDLARTDASVRVILLGAVGKAFSGGHDLKELAGRPAEEVKALFAFCTEVMERIRLHPKPVIAQVQGVAAAAGCQLVATCDLAVAAQSARFGTTGIKAGLFCSTPMVPLARVVPAKKSLEMLLTGDLISAEEAETAGLVNRVVPDSELETATMALARRIAANSPFAIRLGKEAFYRQLPLGHAEAYGIGTPAMVGNVLAEDGQEGIRAFLDKRPPQYKG